MYRVVFHGLSHGLAGAGFFFVRNPGPQHLRAGCAAGDEQAAAGKGMTADELREMQANGMKIGSHTVSHENLAEMGAQSINFEMRESRAALEKVLGKPVYALAYPEGKVNDAVLACVKNHYDMAFLAEVSPEERQTMYTLQRYGVFSWNEHIESIFRNR